MLLLGVGGSIPDTPKNRVALSANEFQRAFRAWAEAFNAMYPGTMDYREMRAFDPLPQLWRNVEKRRREWVAGR